MQHTLFQSKDAKAAYILWEVDDDGNIVGERIFQKENFPSADLAFRLGEWILENKITTEDFNLYESLRLAVKKNKLNPHDISWIIGECYKQGAYKQLDERQRLGGRNDSDNTR